MSLLKIYSNRVICPILKHNRPFPEPVFNCQTIHRVKITKKNTLVSLPREICVVPPSKNLVLLVLLQWLPFFPPPLPCILNSSQSGEMVYLRVAVKKSVGTLDTHNDRYLVYHQKRVKAGSGSGLHHYTKPFFLPGYFDC